MLRATTPLVCVRIIGSVALLLAILAIATPTRRSHRLPPAWLLSPAEMMMVFGDIPAYHCKAKVACTDPYLEIEAGSDVCVYYNAPFNREICCATEDKTADCKAGNGEAACQDVEGDDTDRYKTTTINNTGNCRSCGGTGYKISGSSDGLQHATGKVGCK
jgi:hypothetical protein